MMAAALRAHSRCPNRAGPTNSRPPALHCLGNIVSLLLLNWLVPWVSRGFACWLVPARGAGEQTNLAGAILILVLYGVWFSCSPSSDPKARPRPPKIRDHALSSAAPKSSRSGALAAQRPHQTTSPCADQAWHG